MSRKSLNMIYFILQNRETGSNFNLTDLGLESTNIARHQESQMKLEVEFHRVPCNQTFDFVTGQFVKILFPACS